MALPEGSRTKRWHCQGLGGKGSAGKGSLWGTGREHILETPPETARRDCPVQVQGSTSGRQGVGTLDLGEAAAGGVWPPSTHDKEPVAGEP